MTRSFMLRFLLTLPVVLAVAVAQDAPVAPGGAPAAHPIVVRSDQFTIPQSEVLARLQDAFAGGVLDELILEALAEQRAEAMSVALPTRQAVLSEYDHFIRSLASARGFSDPTYSLHQLVVAAGIDAYYEEAGLTLESVMRRLRVTLIAEACVATEVKVTDEELESNLESLRPLIVSRAQRKVGLSVFDTKEGAAEHLRALQEPKSKTLTQTELLAVQPQPGTIDALADTIFAMQKVGDYAGPVEYRGRFYVVRLEGIVRGGDEIEGAENMTPEELAKARQEREDAVRRRAREMLLSTKIADAVPEWLAKLRDEGKVELLWHPGEATSRPPA